LGRLVARRIGGVISGYLLSTVLVLITFQSFAYLQPEIFGKNPSVQPIMMWQAVTYLLSFLFSAVGGFLAIRISRGSWKKEGVALAILMVAIGIAFHETAFSIVGASGAIAGAFWFRYLKGN
jgi:hypothetical protein